MNKEQKPEIRNLRAIIFILAILSVLSLTIIVLHLKPEYKYRTEVIILDNDNYLEYINVVDYICTEGVRVSNIHLWFKDRDVFYASTWYDAEADKGACIIKIKEKVSN